MDHLNITIPDKFTNNAMIEGTNLVIFFTCLIIHVFYSI